MPNDEFYAQLKQETEGKIKAYKQFSEDAEEAKKSMKFLAKQIEANNQMLQLQGLDIVKFEK